jgi:Icc-related predicted phosphoesterase
VTRRLTLDWSDPRPFTARGTDVIRILAASDEADPALDQGVNREALGPIDLVVGCGDLSPEQVAFLGDAFRAPLVYVRGNHDRGGAWGNPADVPVESIGVDTRTIPGLRLVALGWPSRPDASGRADERAIRRERDAWGQVLRHAALEMLWPRGLPSVVISHVPPKDAGDTPGDPFHEGFAAYRTLLDRLRPRLWLHGHTTRASQRLPVVEHGPTTLVNVTGSVLVELRRAR